MTKSENKFDIVIKCQFIISMFSIDMFSVNTSSPDSFPWQELINIIVSYKGSGKFIGVDC